MIVIMIDFSQIQLKMTSIFNNKTQNMRTIREKCADTNVTWTDLSSCSYSILSSSMKSDQLSYKFLNQTHVFFFSLFSSENT